MNSPLRWGFLGAGLNALESLAPALRSSSSAILQAVASRDPARATALRPVGRCYESYGDVLADPEVDAVYVGLANDAHLEWTLAALRSGRPVLCEKPLSLTATEVDQVMTVAAEAGVAATEALWYRWHSRIRALEALLRSGAIGTPRRVEADFSCPVRPPGYRFAPEHGGGAVFDLGCYVVSIALCAFRQCPIAVEARWWMGDTGVDIAAEASVTFPDGVAELRVGFAEATQTLMIGGTRARIEVEDDPFTDPGGAIKLTGESGTSVIRCTPTDTYRIMIDEVSSALRGGPGRLLPLAESRACAAVIDAWRAAADTGLPRAPVKIERTPTCAAHS